MLDTVLTGGARLMINRFLLPFKGAIELSTITISNYSGMCQAYDRIFLTLNPFRPTKNRKRFAPGFSYFFKSDFKYSSYSLSLSLGSFFRFAIENTSQ